MDLPTGTVTFLFTDVEGSTRLWEDHTAAAASMLARHDELFESIVEGSGGVVVRPRGEGDSRFAVFARAADGVAAAAEVQRAFTAEPWSRPFRVRMALHTGEAGVRAGDYYGPAVNRCARIRAIAHGGQTLLSSATQELLESLPPGVTLRDLGAHRLKDLSEPTRVFQLCHPDLPSEFPPLASLDRARSNLPVQMTSFVGREVEVAEVRKLLETQRLVTLTGAGGSGKTRMALHVAAESLDGYDGGAWLVDLAGIADPALVAAAALSALGLPEQPGRTVEDIVVERLAATRALVVLDNCEHLVGSVATLTDRLLRECAPLTIVTTSREPLGVPGETAWRVPSLSVPDPAHVPSPEGMAAFEAVRLFRARARLVDPEFEITSANAAAVTQVCARLDGIPLAIELAAARLDALTVQQVAAKLDDMFTLLTGGARTALERQQTLRAAVDWSHELLDDAERVMLRRVAVFAGGFTLEAAEDVCAGPDVGRARVLDLLSALVRKSLVLVDRRGGVARYRLLETIRQYAREKLMLAGEVGLLRARHRDHFLALAEEGGPRLATSEQVEWVRRFEAELDNLRGALAWSAADAAGAGASLRMIAALHDFWIGWAHALEGWRWAEPAVARTAEGVGERVRVAALDCAGILAFHAGRFEVARALHGRAHDIGRAAGDPAAEALGLLSLAGITAYEDPERAASLIDEAIELATAAGEDGLRARALNLRSGMLIMNDRYADGLAAQDEAVAIWRGTGDGRRLAGALWNIASVMSYQCRFTEAIALFEEVAATADELNARIEAAGARTGLGHCWNELGERERGDALHAEAIERFADLGLLPQQLQGLLYRAWPHLFAGDAERARPDIDRARRLAARTHIRTANEYYFVATGLLREHDGDLDGAAEDYVTGLRQERTIANRFGIAGYLWRLGGVATARGDGARAARLLGASLAIRERIGTPVSPLQRARWEADLDAARAACGGDEAFDVAFAEGRALSLDDAVAMALGEGDA